MEELKMIACGEQLKMLEELAKSQYQVYNDSADYGIINTPTLQKQIHDICEELAKTYKIKVKDTDSEKKVELFIPFEIEDEGKYFRGVNVEVTLFKSRLKRCKPFFNINILGGISTTDPFLSD